MPRVTGKRVTFGTDDRHSAWDTSFESTVGQRITPRSDDCWIFDNNPDDYGTLSAGLSNTHELAHRWVYRTLVGPIPEGHHLHHRCFTKGCVNPHHLEPMHPEEHIALHQRLRNGAR